MRIAMSLETSGGGSGRHVLDLSRALADRGHDVTVFFAPNRAEASFVDELRSMEGLASVPVSMHRAVGTHDMQSLYNLAAAIRQRRPFDILHGHSSKAGALVRLLPNGIGGTRIYTPHAFRTMDPTLTARGRAFYASVERMLSWRCTKVLTGSQQEAQAAYQIGINRKKVRVINFAIEPQDVPRPNEARTRLGLDADDCVIGFVGRLVHQKAPERLVNALPLMESKAAKLVLVGVGEEMERRLRAVASARGVDDRVCFAGQMRGVDAMPAFDILAVPSRYESLGYVLLEAASLGIPIVSTPVGVAERIVNGGGSGVIVDNTDRPEVWAEALDNAVADQCLPGLKEAAGRKRQTLSIGQMADEVLSAYSPSRPISVRAAQAA